MENNENCGKEKSSSEVNFLLAYVPHIVRNILENLNNCELKKMKLVCSMWKEIAELIINNRIIILTKDIPYEILDEGIERPEILFPFLKTELKPNAEFITEIDEIIKVKREENYWDNYFNKAFYLDECFLSIKSSSPRMSSDGLFLTQIAIFPAISGIKLHRFSFTMDEFLMMNDTENLSISDIIKVPEKEIKCVLWFIKCHNEGLVDEIMAVCATGGVFNASSLNLYRGIAILGENVKAASFPLYQQQYLSRERRDTVNYVEKLKKLKINSNKCIAFVFTSFRIDFKYASNFTAFIEMFPDAPVLLYRYSGYFGSIYIPASGEQQDKEELFVSIACKDKLYRDMGTLVLLWYD